MVLGPRGNELNEKRIQFLSPTWCDFKNPFLRNRFSLQFNDLFCYSKQEKQRNEIKKTKPDIKGMDLTSSNVARFESSERPLTG